MFHKESLPDNAETGYCNFAEPTRYKRYYVKINNVQPHNSGDYQCYSEIFEHVVAFDKAVLHVISKSVYNTVLIKAFKARVNGYLIQN